MLYSLIPPILVVLSLVAMIFFLFKRLPRVKELEEEITEKEITDTIQQTNGVESGYPVVKSSFWDKMKNGMLSFLEKTTKKLRLVFLKLENVFKKWSEAVRKKRRERMSANEEKKDMVTDAELKPKTQQNKLAMFLRKKENAYEIEKKIRPTISDKVVSPKAKTEIKDRLEDILIERIAINPKDMEAYERLGEYYLEIGNCDYSKECFKQVIKLNPMNRSAKFKIKKIEKMISK